jgi:hypothetical protein
MAMIEPRDDKTRPHDPDPPVEADPGRSIERERQDHVIDDASRESWITQLLRGLRLSRRPNAGHDKKGRRTP